MDCRVKTRRTGKEDGSCQEVSILDLMDCRVKTAKDRPETENRLSFQSLI